MDALVKTALDRVNEAIKDIPWDAYEDDNVHPESPESLKLPFILSRICHIIPFISLVALVDAMVSL